MLLSMFNFPLVFRRVSIERTTAAATIVRRKSRKRLLSSLPLQATELLVPDPGLVDDENAPSNFANSAQVYQNVVTMAEEEALLHDLESKMKRRRYERGHWDAVIIQFKEIELNEEDGSLSQTTVDVMKRVRDLLSIKYFSPIQYSDHQTTDQGLSSSSSSSPLVRWMPCHAIQLRANGELKAHVDSVRFSGDLVAGLSLNSSSIMRLRPAPADQLDPDSSRDNNENPHHHPPPQEHVLEGHIDLLLQPRSLYALVNASRYLYTHELLEDQAVFRPTNTVVPRDDRFSIIFRDEKSKDK